ncbi:hypothetical protein MBLNU230_g0325t1 [Neophaeotheca triangularis]
MLSNPAQDATATSDVRRQSHHHLPRQTEAEQDNYNSSRSYSGTMQRPPRGSFGGSMGTGYARSSPTKKDQKHVVFQLIDQEDPRIQARLPMRVMISPRDTTDSIITTVKNFYGLYDYGVSFENKDGISIIAAHDNFDNDMVVYVRTVAQPPPPPPASVGGDCASISPKKPSLGAPFEMRPPPMYSPSEGIKMSAGSAGARSISPDGPALDRRSLSAAPGQGRSHTDRGGEHGVHGEAGDGYSSSDNGGGSVTSSRRSRTEQVNAEISVDNIVEGGRRKRAFESSELPLFVPPQVPMSASQSSISPQRRTGPGNAASPYTYSNQQTFSYTQPMPSPQSYGSGAYLGSGMTPNGHTGAYQQPGRTLRGRQGVTYSAPRQSTGGILPTPDPTVGSVISDEDVALQLMRLGDASNFSHGRTSTSTADDALSGKAEAPSSDEEDSEDERLPQVPAVPRFDGSTRPMKKHRTGKNEMDSEGSADEYENTFENHDNANETNSPHRAMPKPRKSRITTLSTSLKATKPRTGSTSSAKPKHKSISHANHQHNHAHSVPMSPASLPGGGDSRKGSIASASALPFSHNPLNTAASTTSSLAGDPDGDEDDLSSKPRCQRCRKSKKGCDRQRPCGRCKDAGIGIDGCISEDEGNGRKGRYGRHMGVPVRKDENGFEIPAGAGLGGGLGAAGAQGGLFLAPALPSAAGADKSKKRKR